METTCGPEPGWEKAHTPLPQGMGDEWVWLPHDLHQIHGLLQSYDLGRCCFRSAAVQKMLTNQPFCNKWFELYDLYDSFNSPHAHFWFIIHPDYRWEVVRSLRKFAFENDLSPLAMQAAANRCGQHKGFRAYKLPTPDYVPTHFKLAIT